MDQTTRQHLIAYAEGNPPGAQIECDLDRLIDEFIEGQCDPNTTAGIEALMRENASDAREITHQTEESRCLGMVLDRQLQLSGTALSAEALQSLLVDLFVQHSKKHLLDESGSLSVPIRQQTSSA